MDGTRRVRGTGGARRWRVTAGAAALTLSIAAGVALAAPGDLDSTWDGDGRRVVEAGGDDHAYGVTIRGDGRVVVVGFGGLGSGDTIPPDLLVTQLKTDGSTDGSFGAGGVRTIGFGGAESGSEVVLQSDGRAVVAGHTTGGTAGDAVVARLTTGGGLDPTFSGDGKQLIDWAANDQVHDAILQADNKVLVAGYSSPSTGFRVSRLNTDGTLDGSFGGGTGSVAIPFGALQPNGSTAANADRARGLAVDAAGRIIVVGSTGDGGTTNVALARLNTNGTLDGSFGIGGKVVIELSGNDQAHSVQVQQDGKIVVGGFGGPAANFVIMRLLSDGSLDPSFAGPGPRPGVVSIDFGGDDRGRAITLQANGKVVISGETTASNDVAFARVQPGGALDSTFSGDGKVVIAAPGDDDILGTNLGTDGKIYYAGSTSLAKNMVVGRIEGDGPGGGAAAPGFGPPADTPAGPATGSSGTVATVLCRGRKATVIGTTGPDRLKGTPGDDIIAALGGNDVVVGLGGKDIICGGPGNDTIIGGRGDDTLIGSIGNDRLLGGPGADFLLGQAGKDTLLGQAGKDRLFGGAGRDKLNGGPGKDQVVGGLGRDTLLGARGKDRVLGVELPGVKP